MFLHIYADSRLHKMYNIQSMKPFFEPTNFPAVVQNGSASVVLENPWVNGTIAAPFDQAFCLILDVAVAVADHPESRR